MSDDPKPITEWNRNTVAIRMPAEEAEMWAAINEHANRMMRRSLDVMFNPWKGSDRNPMPFFAWWPQIDRAIALRAFVRSEIPARVRGAIDVLRYGVSDTGDDW